MHVLLHLEAHACIRRQTHRVAAQAVGQTHLFHLLAQCLLHEGQHILQGLRLLLGLLLLLLRLQTQIIGGDVTEGFLPILHEGLGDELIHILRKEQHIVALLTEGLHLGQLGQTVLALAGGKIDLLLAFGHGVHIGLETHQLPFLVGPE